MALPLRFDAPTAHVGSTSTGATVGAPRVERSRLAYVAFVAGLCAAVAAISLLARPANDAPDRNDASVNVTSTR